MDGFENHAQYCIAIFGPSVLMAMVKDRPSVIAAFRMWDNRNAPRLIPAIQREPVALLAPMKNTSSAIETNWIDWRAYLELLFKVRRVA